MPLSYGIHPYRNIGVYFLYNFLKICLTFHVICITI
nr:MAG TPA: resistance to inhibitors of cholinesterase-like protein [Caudoviricetes sp.]